MNKKNIIIIVLVIILAALSVAIGVVSIDKDQSMDTKSDQYKQFNTIDISKCSHQTCNETFTFNNNKISIVVDESLNYQIRYNKKVIQASSEYPYLGDKIYTFDNKLVYLVYSDPENFYDVVYDPDDLNFQKFTLLKEDPDWIYKSVEVNDNKITIKTDRFLNDTDFVDAAAHNMLPITTCENFQKYADYDAYKAFEITYKDGKFSKAVNTETLPLKEYKEYRNLCN